MNENELQPGEKAFEVRYEVPPMRAIWTTAFGAQNEQEVRDYIAEHEPKWVIRGIIEQHHHSKKEG